MKTLEEKARSYDEAVNKLRRFMAQGVEPLITRADVQDFFPELAESEDEKIRRELIAHFRNNSVSESWSGLNVKKVLAWLEKQGQEKHLSEPIKDYQGSFTCWNNAHDFRPKHLQRCICYDKYMGGVYCYVYDDISKYWCTQTTEEHDSDGDNHISDYADYRITLWMPLPDTSFYPSKSLLEKQGEQPQGKTALEAAKEEKVDNQNCVKPTDKVEPKFKVKYAGNEYNVFETKDIAGVTFYGIEDEPNHIDYVKAENCEIISVYAIKENGSPYPTKPAVFSEKKPKRMISAEAKEAMYDKPACVGRNDTLLDLLHKMPSCITVGGIDYHFVLKKTIAYMAYYAGEEEGSGKVIFWMAGDPVDLLTAMLEKLKEKGLLE